MGTRSSRRKSSRSAPHPNNIRMGRGAYSNPEMSLKDEISAGIDLLSFFDLFDRGSRFGKVGIRVLDFHFSMAVVAGAAGMWESRQRFPRARGQRWKTCFWFSSLSIARHFRSSFAVMPLSGL